MVERKLLIVDDNREFRSIFARTLRRRGFQVGEAKDGADALRLVEKEHPSLVVSDCHMPRMTGQELVEALADRFPELPIILISGESQSVPAHTTAFFSKGGSVITLAERVGHIWDTIVAKLDPANVFRPVASP